MGVADLPLAMLLHSVTVEPYLSWGAYGPPQRMRCTVSEQIAARRGQAGVEQVTDVTLYARKKAVCPPGSKVTLKDGRVGYAVATVVYDGGGLPTPDHTEIAVNIAAPVYGPAFGETVLLKRAGDSYQDRYGNTRRRFTDTPVAGCAVRPLGSSEQVSNTNDRVSINIEVVMPPGTAVSATDRMVVRGLLFDVNGEPTAIQDNLTGADVGVRVIGLRQTG